MVQQGEDCSSQRAELDLASFDSLKPLTNATLIPSERTVTSGYSVVSVCGKTAVYDLKHLLFDPKYELKKLYSFKTDTELLRSLFKFISQKSSLQSSAFYFLKRFVII